MHLRIVLLFLRAGFGVLLLLRAGLLLRSRIGSGLLRGGIGSSLLLALQLERTRELGDENLYFIVQDLQYRGLVTVF